LPQTCMQMCLTPWDDKKTFKRNFCEVILESFLNIASIRRLKWSIRPFCLGVLPFKA
jgi:hypothetical protein